MFIDRSDLKKENNANNRVYVVYAISDKESKNVRLGQYAEISTVLLSFTWCKCFQSISFFLYIVTLINSQIQLN